MNNTIKCGQIKAIRNYAKIIQNLLDNNDQMRSHGQKYFKLLCLEEKEHRRKDFICEHGLSVLDASKLFGIQYIAELMLNKRPMPEIKDYLTDRKSIYYAAAIVLNYEYKISNVLSKDDLYTICTFDYIELNS